MPEGRMLKKCISESKKLGALKNDSARLLYTWLLPHLDVEGRHSADPDIIKGHVFPKIKSMTISKIKKLLKELDEAKLIILYKANDELYLQLEKFHKYQKIDKNREAKSKIPAPTEENIINSGINHENSRLNQIKSPISLNKINKNKIKKECSEKYSELAIFLERKIKEKLPRYRFQGKRYKENWANTFRIMIDKKEATEDEIKRLIAWIFDESDFWYKNILSADKLRKQFGRLWAESGLQKEEEEQKKYNEWLKKR